MRVEEIEDPFMQKLRYMDKLIDELAKGKGDGENSSSMIEHYVSRKSIPDARPPEWVTGCGRRIIDPQLAKCRQKQVMGPTTASSREAEIHEQMAHRSGEDSFRSKWVQLPPGNRSSRKQPEQLWR